MLHVSKSELIVDDDSGAYFYNDQPFTGIACQTFINGERQEVAIVNGRKEGFVRHWYKDGQIHYERSVLGGRRHGPTREWHPNGKLKLEEVYEFGIRVRRTEWDDQGQVVGNFELDPNSFNQEALNRLRETKWGDPAVEQLLRPESDAIK